MTRAELVAAAERTIRDGSKSFRAASRLFDRRTRERAWLLYAWCRRCDDLADGQLLGRPDAGGAQGRIEEIKAKSWAALAGGRTGEAPFDALAVVVEECAIPHSFVHDHIEGFAMDAAGWQPSDEADLLDYCYRVAGAVGCMMAVVMGVDPRDSETLERAADLGRSFQLANIARDLAEDHRAGRCYLPRQWLAEAGVDPLDPLRPERRDALVRLALRLTDLAAAQERSALAGVAKLPFRSRWAVLAAARIYGGIGREVAARGPRAWDERVTVPRRAKLAMMLAALAEAAGQPRPRSSAFSRSTGGA